MPSERRLSSAILGGAFLGLIMAFFGFLPQAGPDQPLPIWVWRTVGGGGVLLAVCTLPAKSGKEWARRLAMAGLGLTIVPLVLLIAFSVIGGRFNPFLVLLAFGVLACCKGIAFYNSPEIKACFGGPPVPLVAPVTPPACPKCKVALSGTPTYCPACGFPVRGTPMRFRWVWTLLIFIVVPFFMNRSAANKAKVAESGVQTVVDTEITIEADSTYWAAVEPSMRAEVVLRVTAKETPIGINFGPVGADGFTPKLDELMRDTQTEVDPGKRIERVFPVEAKRKYAAFVINETDMPAKAQIKMTLRWGTPK